MPLFGKELTSLTEADIDNLVASGDAEAKMIEYKAKLPDFDAPPRARDEVMRAVAMHSLYGYYLPQLLWLDRDWTERNIERIFPADAKRSQYGAAAWDAFLIFRGPSALTFDLLVEQYSQAVDRIGTPSTSPSNNPDFVPEPNDSELSDADTHLIQHLMELY
jgi:hypothetical protein